jgi:hypothetical protein
MSWMCSLSGLVRPFQVMSWQQALVSSQRGTAGPNTRPDPAASRRWIIFSRISSHCTCNAGLPGVKSGWMYGSMSTLTPSKRSSGAEARL